MNAKFLAVVVLILTLVIGFLIGLLTARGTWRPGMPPDRPHPPMGRMLDPDFFAERMEYILGVTDEQRDTVRAILENHSDRFIEMHENQAETMRQLMDTLLNDLKGVLSQEQIDRFEEHLTRRRFGPRRHKRFAPGPNSGS